MYDRVVGRRSRKVEGGRRGRGVVADVQVCV